MLWFINDIYIYLFDYIIYLLKFLFACKNLSKIENISGPNNFHITQVLLQYWKNKNWFYISSYNRINAYIL